MRAYRPGIAGPPVAFWGAPPLRVSAAGARPAPRYVRQNGAVSKLSPYGFLRRPRWIAGHLLALMAVVAFVQLGLWQFRRLDERREFNAQLETRTAAGFVPLDDLMSQFGDDPEVLALRRVRLVGTYVPAEEVIVQARSRNGVSGHHVATPLLLADGRAVIIDRGWVPIDVEGPPVVGAETPGVPVVVDGLIREPQLKGSFGPTDPPEGVLDRVARVDVPRLQQQSALDLFEFYVELEAQQPQQTAGLPLALKPPDLGEGSHLSYGIQWFIFATVTVVGYPILLRRTAHPRRTKTRTTA